MSYNGHPINLLKDKSELASAQRGGGRRIPKRKPAAQPRLGTAATLICVGLVTGLAEAAGNNIDRVYDSATVIMSSPWSWPGVGGVAVIAIGKSEKGRAGICALLRWTLSRLEARSFVLMTMVVLLGAATTLSACADTLSDRFRFIKFGLTEEATVAVMGGPPTSRAITKTVGGVTFETLRWQAPERTFLVRLVGVPRLDEPRVISTRTCEGSIEC
jgi:hypothetical protein